MTDIVNDLLGRTRRHARWRRSLAWAILLAAALHALVLAFLAVPDPTERYDGKPSLVVVPMAPRAQEPLRREIASPEEAADGETSAPERRLPAVRPADRRAAVPVVVETPGAPEETTIPSTDLDAELRARTLPLEAGPTGIRRRAPSAETLARARAESLANARLASLPGAGRPKAKGAVGLSGGGVTVQIPWQGFVREDREDDTWRDERCEGEDGGEDDKPGEGEARRSQCG